MTALAAAPADIAEHAGLILLDPEQHFDVQDKQLAAGASERIPFRGGLTCSCVVTSYPLLEMVMLIRGRISSNLDAYQFGYRNDVSASAGTHAGGGNTDIGQLQDADLAIERECGWEFQHRTQAQGFSMDHCHGGPKGCPHMSPGGHAQQIDWENGRNGLASHGPITGPGPIGKDTPHWQDGVKHMRGIILSFQQDIINALKPELDAIKHELDQVKAQTTDIGRQVIVRDGLIPNSFNPADTKNKTISLATSIRALMQRQREQGDTINAIKAAQK